MIYKRVDEGKFVWPRIEDGVMRLSPGRRYVSRILRLALLAPDIVEAILAGRTDQHMMLNRLERPLPMRSERGCPRRSRRSAVPIQL